MYEDIIQRYQRLGFERVEVEEDPPNFKINYHFHPADNVLHILTGKMKVLIDGSWRTLEAGQSLKVKHGKIHKSTIGPEGCRFIRAAKY